MKKLFNTIQEWFKKTLTLEKKDEEKLNYKIILNTGDQSIDFDATPSEFKTLFSKLKGIKVFKADNIIVPITSIAYWYIETEETKKIKEENAKIEAAQKKFQSMMGGGAFPGMIPQTPNVAEKDVVEVKEEKKIEGKKRGRPSKKKVEEKVEEKK